MDPQPMMRALRGSSLTQRAMRSSVITMGGFAGSQAIRLASNLILTRLLFPEAFGVMAMVSVFLMGLAMFSDVGIGPAIMQSKRGDDRDFLDTAWTIQILRGACLFVVAVALAWPMAWYYGEPDLVQYLPVSAVTLLIAGFNPTRLETANRHMQAGRITLIDLATQLVGIATAVALAFALQSVWALVFSGILSMLAQLYFLDRFLPGPRNRLRWEPAARHELIRFGKWIFLSTVCGFAISQADKVVIGRFLDTATFGVYNIGYFLASFPLLLAGVVTRRVLIPIYRESPPGASRANFLRLRRMRMIATGGLMAMVTVLAFGGLWIIEVLYDARYYAAGGVVVLMSVVQMPALVGMTYDQAALAAGDSRSYFILAATRAALIVAGLVIGLDIAAVEGALIGLGLAWIASYPVVIWLARAQGAWDPLHDALFAAYSVAVAALVFWLFWPEISALSLMAQR